MIICGWCGKPTANTDRCSTCGHADPARPWVQRGQDAPVVANHDPGRPTLDVADIRRRIAAAQAQMKAAGKRGTVDELAEALDVSPRTARRWTAAIRTNAIGGPPTTPPRGLL